MIGPIEALAERIVARIRRREYGVLQAEQRDRARRHIGGAITGSELVAIRDEVIKHTDVWDDELQRVWWDRYLKVVWHQ